MAESKAPRSTKRKFVADGLFLAELNEFFQRELAEEGYAGVEVRTNRLKPEIIIKATRTQNVLGERGRRIRELTSLVQQRFGFKSDGVELFAERVQNRALCAIAQAESVRYKLIEGLNVRRACYGVLRKVILGGAMGCEIVVTGKLRGQRAKAMKFRDGFMIKSGDATNHYIDSAVRHINLKQGVLGIKVKIQLPYDPEGKDGGVTIPLPDVITIKEPKEDPLATAIVPGGLDVPTTMAPGPAPVGGPVPAPMGTPGGYTQPEPVGVGPVPVGPAPL